MVIVGFVEEHNWCILYENYTQVTEKWIFIAFGFVFAFRWYCSYFVESRT